jgi:hypothetical protein
VCAQINQQLGYEAMFVDSFDNLICKKTKTQSGMLKDKTKKNVKMEKNMGGTTILLPLNMKLDV